MALPTDEKGLMALRAETKAAIENKKKNGKDAKNYRERLNQIDAKLSEIRATNKEAPKPEDTPGAGQTGSGGAIDPSAGGATTGINTGALPANIPKQLLEGLNLGKALYPDGSLGRMPNPSPIGPLGAWDKVEMVDTNGIPKVSVIDTTKIPKVGAIDPNSIKNVPGVTLSDIPQIKEISEAADNGLVSSIGQWDDYYQKTQQRDANIDAALNRAMKFADEGYSGQDMQAKRAKSNRVIDSQTQTALRDLRNAQGSAGNFGGVAGARQKDLMKDSLMRKAMTESDLLAGEADFKLNANNQAGQMANTAYQTYNNAQQAGLKGLTDTRAISADNLLKREMSNQDAQKGNQSAYLEGTSQRLTADIANQGKDTDIAKANQDAEGKNAGNWLTGEQIRGQQEGTNAANVVDVLQGNQTAQGTNSQIQTQRDIADKDIQGGNIQREQDTIKSNMGQSEKEKALQAGTGISYWQYLSAEDQQKVLNAIQKQLADATTKGL